LVYAVTDQGRTLDDALGDTASFVRLTGPDRGFARAIATATLRRLGGIDAVLAQLMTRPLEAQAGIARAILRTGAAQLLVLGVAAHAAVSEAVTLANAAPRARPFAGLINAVLRKVAADGGQRLAALPPGTDLPPWLYSRWQLAYGPEVAAAIANSLRAEPPLDLSPRSDAAALAAAVGGQVLPNQTVRLRDGATITELDGFSEGTFWVQDAAARLPVALLGPQPGQRIYDLCAAPGGKTLQLAAAGAQVTAVDQNDQRLGRLSENLARTGLPADIVCADARSWQPLELAEAVLLDAPCSATGTLRRHPDVAWLRRPEDLATLTTLQASLITQAAKLVQPGGVLVYAVCSLEPEEGPAIVATLLAAGGWNIEPAGVLLPQEWAALVAADGTLRSLPCYLPDLGGLDGFYAARLRRMG
jgi:16S rRNA (cytosine967-C5)-methyltransferase